MRPLMLVALAASLAATSASAAVSPRAKVLVRVTSVGGVLADSRGHTLYSYAADKARKSACYAACAATWPPFLTAGKPLAGLGVRGSLLGTTKRKDGKLQVTYAGRPLYFFAAERKAGELDGQGYSGKWWALDASGAKVTRLPEPTSTAPPPDGCCRCVGTTAAYLKVGR
jgi:predicted lipoprotein with Yx(FWY)xxD motif